MCAALTICLVAIGLKVHLGLLGWVLGVVAASYVVGGLISGGVVAVGRQSPRFLRRL